MPEHEEYLCPRCGARLINPAAPCPRCGNLFSSDSRQSQIENHLNHSSPLDAAPALSSAVPAGAGSFPAQPYPYPPAAPPTAAAVPAPPSAPAAGTPLSPSRLHRWRKVWIPLVILVGLAVLVAGVWGVYRLSLGYNASPIRLVDGLNAAIREGDEDLLMSLINPDEQENFSYSSLSPIMELTRFDFEAVDAFVGEKGRYAQIFITSARNEDFIIPLTARKIEDSWYFSYDSLFQITYFSY